jgi:aryl-alcohol dehydrogenase-like predicted oxidoreductase
MEYRYLAGTGLRVSALSFGTVTFGGKGDWYDKVGGTQVGEARELLSIAIDAGINLIDSADSYSGGLSEEILGEALGTRRDSVLLATKLQPRMSADVNDIGLSRHHIMRACEASLRRLRTDRIDLYQIHAFDALTDVDLTLGALTDLVRQGKVRYIGCSNLSAWHIMKSLASSERRGLERFVVSQSYYSLLCRDLEHEVLPLCLDQGLGVLVWSPLAGGFLSGKFTRENEWPANTRIATAGFPELDLDHAFAVVEVASTLASQRGVTVAEVSLNWLLERRGVTSLILGARNREQLEINLRALSWRLSAEELDRLDRASARPMPYPYWHQFHYNSERQPGLHERSFAYLSHRDVAP